MLETVICICGALVLGGIAKVCTTEAHYSEEYYRYLRDNKSHKKSAIVRELELYRYI